MSKDKKTFQETWESYWKEICANPDGSINLDQIQRELADYAFMLDQVPSVYSEVTGGTLSKPNYHANSVIGCYEDHLNEIVKNHIEDIIEQVEGMKCGLESYDSGLDEVIEFLKEEYSIIKEVERDV